MQAFAVGFSKHPVRVTLWPSLLSLTILTWKIAMAFCFHVECLNFQIPESLKKQLFLEPAKLGEYSLDQPRLLLLLLLSFFQINPKCLKFNEHLFISCQKRSE